MVHAELADHLQAAFVAHWADQLPIAYENVDPATDLGGGFVQVHTNHLEGAFDAVGSNRIRHQAVWTLRVHAPEEGGMIAAYAFADSALNFLETYDPPAYAYRPRFQSVQELGANGGFTVIECRATIDYWEDT